MMLRHTLGLAGTLVVVAACGGSTVTDDTFAEPSRAQRIDALASAACDHYGDRSAGCPGYGTDDAQRYASETDCEADFQKRAADLWPADQCSNNRIDQAGYDRCVERAKVYACSTGLGSVFDAISAISECGASEVCTDVPSSSVPSTRSR